MPNLQKVIKVTQSQYNTLESGGTVGEYTGLDSHYMYLVVDDNNYKINTVYAYDNTNDEWRDAGYFNSEDTYGTYLTLPGHLLIYGDDDNSDSRKPNDETGSDDLDTTIFNTGVYLSEGYKISWPAQNGVFAVTSDIPSTYLKTASVSSNTLTLTKQDDTTVTYTPSFTDTNQKVTAKLNGSNVSFGNNDVVEFVAGSNITITPDTSAKTVTIASTASGSANTISLSTTSLTAGTPVEITVTQADYNKAVDTTKDCKVELTTTSDGTKYTINRIMVDTTSPNKGYFLEQFDYDTLGSIYVGISNNSGTYKATVLAELPKYKNYSLDTSSSTSTGAVKYVEAISSTGASDSGKYMHFSAGTTPPSGASFSGTSTTITPTLGGTTTFNTDAIKSVSLSASGTSTDGPVYVQSISGSAPSLGGTTTFVTGYSSFSGGSGSLTSNDTSTDGIKYISEASHTAASLGTASTGTVTVSGGTTTGTTKYLSASFSGTQATITPTLNAGTTKYLSASFSGTQATITPTLSSATTKYLSASFSGTETTSLVTGVAYHSSNTSALYGNRTTSGSGTSARRTLEIKSYALAVSKNSYTPGGSVTLTANDSSATGRITYVQAQGSITGATYTPAGSVTLTANDSTATGRITYLQSQGTITGATYTPAGSVTLTENDATATGRITYLKSLSSTGASLGGTTTFVTGYPDFSGGSASHTTKYLHHTHTGASLGTASTGTVSISGGSYSATSKYMKATGDSASTGTVTITGASYTPAGSVSFTSGTAPSLTFNTTASGGEYYVTDVSGGTTSATTKYLTLKEDNN